MIKFIISVFTIKNTNDAIHVQNQETEQALQTKCLFNSKCDSLSLSLYWSNNK